MKETILLDGKNLYTLTQLTYFPSDQYSKISESKEILWCNDNDIPFTPVIKNKRSVESIVDAWQYDIGIELNSEDAMMYKLRWT